MPNSPTMVGIKDEVARLAASSPSAHELMTKMAALLHEKMLKYNWVGFYMIDEAARPPVLVLGPFQGAMTPHTRIPLHQGICGAAASTGKTVIVDDVSKDPRYLACSLETKSEIVAPVFRKGKVAGELDIDSHFPAAFSADDRDFVEYCAALVGKKLESSPGMRVEKGKVRAPEIGRVWFNSSPLSFRQLRGRVVLVDFWDYTCVNCIRTLPYIQAWHERYGNKGLTVIGVHTPEFTFAQYESNVERGIREFGLTYPIVVDSDREIWKAFANRYWPTKYLLDKEGYLRYAHFGEGAYRETEEAIRELLLEVNSTLVFPPLMEAIRPEDREGAVCYSPSAELYLGNGRGRIGNEGGFKEDAIADYALPDKFEENCFYAGGRWASTAEYFEAAGEGEHRIVLKYQATGVNLVMAAPRGGVCDVAISVDGKPLTRAQKSTDTRFRSVDGGEESYVSVQQARMYSLLNHHEFGEHLLELRCPAGTAVFAFTFTSCVDPSGAGVTAAVGSAQ